MHGQAHYFTPVISVRPGFLLIRLIVPLIVLSFMQTGCTVEKRRYRKGYHVEKRSGKDTEAHNPKVSAFYVGFGCYRIVQDPKTRAYFKNHFAPDFKIGGYCKNFFVWADCRPMTFNPRQSFLFRGKELTSVAKINHNRAGVVLGYRFSYRRFFEFEPYMGYLSTDFRVINEEELNVAYGIEKARGFTFGFSVTRSVQLDEVNYVTFSLNNNFNVSDYSKVYSEFGSYFYGVSLTIGFRLHAKHEQ